MDAIEPKKLSSAAKRQAAFAARKKASGLKKVTLWVNDTQIRHIDAYLKPNPIQTPPLVGTSAQVQWAKEIQEKFFEILRESEASLLAKYAGGDIELHAMALNVLNHKRQAKYWIENRFLSASDHYKRALKNKEDEPLNVLTLARLSAHKERTSYIEQITLLPENGKKTMLVDVSIEDKIVKLKSHVFDESFNKLVKAYGYTWDQPFWVKQVLPIVTPLDSAATIITELLRAKIACIVPDDALRETVSANTYKPEPGRVLTAILNKKEVFEFRLNWIPGFELGWDDKRFISNIKGAHIFEDRVAFVPDQHYAEIMELCEKAEFYISQEAKDLAEAMKSSCLGGKRVKKSPHRVFKPSLNQPTIMETSHESLAQFLDN